MDGNKDEADRCIQIALRCIQAGDREKARKFLNKAERLYPSDRVRGEREETIFTVYFSVTLCQNIGCTCRTPNDDMLYVFNSSSSG